jgi:hypothetical protein
MVEISFLDVFIGLNPKLIIVPYSINANEEYKKYYKFSIYVENQSFSTRFTYVIFNK